MLRKDRDVFSESKLATYRHARVSRIVAVEDGIRAVAVAAHADERAEVGALLDFDAPREPYAKTDRFGAACRARAVVRRGRSRDGSVVDFEAFAVEMAPFLVSGRKLNDHPEDAPVQLNWRIHRLERYLDCTNVCVRRVAGGV